MNILRRIKLLLYISIIVLICIRCKKEHNQWAVVAKGIWRYEYTNKEKTNLLDAAKTIPNLNRLNEFEDTPFPLNKDSINIIKQNGKLYLRFPLEKDEEIYGLGLQFKQVNRRGQIYNLHVDHYGGVDNGRTHAPVPFYISSKGYGVLINSARYITVYVGSAVRVNSANPPKVYNRNKDKDWDAQPTSDAVEILIPVDDAEIIVFGGKSPLEVVQKYNLYNGGGCLPSIFYLEQ